MSPALTACNIRVWSCHSQFLATRQWQYHDSAVSPALTACNIRVWSCHSHFLATRQWQYHDSAVSPTLTACNTRVWSCHSQFLATREWQYHDNTVSPLTLPPPLTACNTRFGRVTHSSYLHGSGSIMTAQCHLTPLPLPPPSHPYCL